MMYKGFDISFHQPMIEKCGIDENGNSVSFRDAWQTGEGWYQAERDNPDGILTSKKSLEDIKTQIDALIEGES